MASPRSALAPHHAAIKDQILRLLNHSSPDELRRFLEEISIQQDVLESIYDLWPDLPHAYDAEREELADERKEVYILYDAALDDREKIRRRWERLLGKHRWGRHEVDELRKCRDYMARNAVKMVGLCVEYAEFSSQIQGLAPFEDEVRVKLEKLYVDEHLSTTSKLRRMRNILNLYYETAPRAERYSYRRRSLSPDGEEDYWVPKPVVEPPDTREPYVSISYQKQRSRPDRHDNKRHRRERDAEQPEPESYPEFSYEVEDIDGPNTQHVYMADSARHAFRSSSHDTSFLWRSRPSKDDDYNRSSGRRFSISYTHLPRAEARTEKRRASSGVKHHRPSRYEDDEERNQRRNNRYLDVPKPTSKPKQYTSWEVYEVV
ncbi:hypothetical protein DRE_00055 [Drechslerella stenobrocha 248]|uniref:Uncharacterized protein n=1 Tax=Drechslerella stenobrocha 248 TaxID=1043628 RepID=W7IHL7_9PEZI|nr:hypothetical protein DRE_00055 [Drechslerella stenobrocha 248]